MVHNAFGFEHHYSPRVLEKVSLYIGSMPQGEPSLFIAMNDDLNAELRKIRPLKNPPINEAVIEVRFKPAEDITRENLKGLVTVFADEYPMPQPRKLRSLNISVEDPNEAESDHQVIHSDRFIGFRCDSPDGKSQLMLQPNALSFHKLKPYGGWDSTVGSFDKAWKRFREQCPISSISRLGVRYINEFCIPTSEGVQLGRYLNSLPKKPLLWPSQVTMYSGEYQFPSPKNSATVRHFFAVDEGEIRVLLDIDAFATGELPTDESIAARLIELRDLKNRIFFGAVTEETIKLFE